MASGCFYSFDLESMHRYAKEAVRCGQEAGRSDLVADAIGWMAFAAQSQGDVAKAMELHREALATAGTRPVMSRTGVALTFYLVGALDEAVDTGRSGVEMARATNHTWAIMNGLPHFALALAGKGRYAEALKVFEEARSFGKEHAVWPFLARSIGFSAGFHLDIYDYAGNQALAEEAREAALAGDFLPTAVSAGIDLIFNATRRREIASAEAFLKKVAEDAAEVGGWHGWLWQLRLAEARAELALARGDAQEAVRCAGEAIEQSEARRRPKYKILGLWTRGRALSAQGHRAEAIGELRHGLELARVLGDPAMLLRVSAELLALDGNDQLLKQATGLVRQIRAELPSEELRARFDSAEPVCLVTKLAGAAA